jgi:hypothetical protein
VAVRTLVETLTKRGSDDVVSAASTPSRIGAAKSETIPIGCELVISREA